MTCSPQHQPTGAAAALTLPSISPAGGVCSCQRQQSRRQSCHVSSLQLSLSKQQHHPQSALIPAFLGYTSSTSNSSSSPSWQQQAAVRMASPRVTPRAHLSALAAQSNRTLERLKTQKARRGSTKSSPHKHDTHCCFLSPTSSDTQRPDPCCCDLHHALSQLCVPALSTPPLLHAPTTHLLNASSPAQQQHMSSSAVRRRPANRSAGAHAQQQQQHDVQPAASADGRSSSPHPPLHITSRRRLLLAPAVAAAVLSCVVLALSLSKQQHHPESALIPAFLGYTSSNGSSDSVRGPALGIFPQGCRWRDVAAPAPGANNDSSSSAPVSYEYWDSTAQAWTAQQPAACRLQGSAGPAGSDPWQQLHKGNPRTEVVPSAHHVTYRNLWYNNGRWYALVDSGRTIPSWKFSKNHEVTTLHVQDARAWLSATRWRVVPGDTLLFDFIFFTHPTAIGHWWELLGPLFSVLKSGGASGFKRPCDQMVLLHLKRTHLMEWVRAVMAVALGVGPAQDLPPILLQQETDHPWQQLTMPLEGVAADEWVLFDTVLIVRDLFTGGNRSFTSSSDAREFRAEVYQHYGLPAPARRWRVPRVITFQRKRANRRIINEAELLQLMSRYGEVRVVEFNSSTPFAEQLRTMRETGVFVSAHTSNLANAVFLQPGSAVVEIIQRHWTWNNMDQSFRDHTSALGDLHHYAWRANHPNETVYYSERDAARFTSWTKSECLIEDCTEAATRVDIVVDLPAFQALLDSTLPKVFRGKSVAAAALPWPEAL